MVKEESFGEEEERGREAKSAVEEVPSNPAMVAEGRLRPQQRWRWEWRRAVEWCRGVESVYWLAKARASSNEKRVIGRSWL